MRALILEDEVNLREILKMLVGEFGYEISEAGSLKEAFSKIDEKIYDLILVDLRLPDGFGMEVVRNVKKEQLETEIIIITAFATTETIKEAFELGVYDYIEKPFNVDELKLILRNVTEKIRLKGKTEDFPLIVGKSKVIERLKEQIKKIAPYDVNVLILGESGTGKELVARAIHKLSPRRNKSFVAINCAALPMELLESELFGYKKGAFTGALFNKMGLIEKADGGTLFLDEIGDMPLQLQAKLLRFLEEKTFIPLGSTQEKRVNVRVLAATNKDLKREIENGRFREDLYYRLATITLCTPSLRERREDIPILVEYFADIFSKKYKKRVRRISPRFIKYLSSLPLEGNVRELKNLVEREVILLDEDGILGAGYSSENFSIQDVEIPPEGVDLKKILEETEKKYLLKALKVAKGKKTKAAELLGLTFREFRYRLGKYTPQRGYREN
ncbi:MAG: sigma-54-dependent Fis family transcriptional regulator [Thermovibrio sp.]|nr:MAG: sigma-54-dependent Fis family transcriptional regulator [Thermovibrio sp.]